MSNRFLTLVPGVCALALTFAVSSSVVAQPQPPGGPGGPGRLGPMVMPFPPGGPGGPDVVGFAGPGPFEPPVEGLPYIADVTTEFHQEFADGNRVEHKSTATVARDSQGRTRREQTLGPPPGAQAEGEARQVILINDPVAKVAYSLDPEKRTAIKLTMPDRLGARLHGDRPAPRRGPDGDRWNHPAPPPEDGISPDRGPRDGRGVMNRFGGAEPVRESLGTKAVNGIDAEGTRTTLTIPAGAMGNVKPIQIVTERWFAPSLKIVVLSRHSDPRSGETVYQLSNIRREEPGQDLFAVPDGYTVTAAPKPFMRWRGKDDE